MLKTTEHTSGLRSHELGIALTAAMQKEHEAGGGAYPTQKRTPPQKFHQLVHHVNRNLSCLRKGRIVPVVANEVLVRAA